MLLDIGAGYTNVVVCRHKNLLFARSIPIGSEQLSTEKMATRLVLELTSCTRYFGSMYRKVQIERLIFFSGSLCTEGGKNMCTTIAKQLGMPAQRGNCLTAVEMSPQMNSFGVDRRECHDNWATAFGLSLS